MEIKKLPWDNVAFLSDQTCLSAAEIIVILTEQEALPQVAEPYGALLQKIKKTEPDFLDYGKLTAAFMETATGLQHILVMGLSAKQPLTVERVRSAAGNAARKVSELASGKIAVYLPQSALRAAGFSLGEQLAHGFLSGIYSFHEYKQPEKNAAKRLNLTFCLPGELPIKAVQEEILTLAASTSWARDLVNRPGNALLPRDLAEEAGRMAEECGLACEILTPTEMRTKKMGALLAVAQGSENEPRLVTVKYEGRPGAPWTALVGKGITFDTGGISLKPEAGMGEMKDDMAGAATVLAAMRTIALLKLPCNVMAIASCAENMPSGGAYRPGDIVRAANGKTIEVISTDAEGRLVLADAVNYACVLGAEEVVDIATLTGAVIIALGKKTAGIVTNDDALAERIKAAGRQNGESFWQLPSLPECAEAIKGDIADLLNSAGRPGGAITGGLFIGEFIAPGVRWAHLDIGGTASSDKAEGHLPKGATGFGVATLYFLLKDK